MFLIMQQVRVMVPSKRLGILWLVVAASIAGQSIPFQGTATCVAKASVVTVPGCQANSAQPTGCSPGGEIDMRDDTCYWSGVEFGGQPLKSNRVLAIGIFNAPPCYKAEGFDVGTLANGDQSQGQTEEDGCATTGGTIKWRIVSGTGVIKGIKGSGTIKCAPTQIGTIYLGETATPAQAFIATCQVSGTYTLPKPAPKKPQKK